MKNTKATLRDIAVKFYGKKDVEAIERHDWGEIRVMTENMVTDGSTIITTDPDKIDYSGFMARGGETEKTLKKVITPYLERDYTRIPESLHGFIKNGVTKFFGFGISGRWASIYSKITRSEYSYRDPEGMEFTDGAEIMNATGMQGRAVFGREYLAKCFKAFRVKWFGINVNSIYYAGCNTLKSARIDCTYRGTDFSVIVLQCFEDEEILEIADTAETYALAWDNEDRMAGRAHVA